MNGATQNSLQVHSCLQSFSRQSETAKIFYSLGNLLTWVATWRQLDISVQSVSEQRRTHLALLPLYQSAKKVYSCNPYLSPQNDSPKSPKRKESIGYVCNNPVGFGELHFSLPYFVFRISFSNSCLTSFPPFLREDRGCLPTPTTWELIRVLQGLEMLVNPFACSLMCANGRQKELFSP